MPTERECRLRLRWPSGAEFEAEGPPDFIAQHSGQFTASLPQATAASPAPGPERPRLLGPGVPAEPALAWDEICDYKGNILQLRAKLAAGKTERDACLVLLACARHRLQEPKPAATQLAKWLRRSGYPVGRMDRALQDAVAQGEILASGSRRSRRYELTAPGKLKALLLAEELSRAVTAQP